MFNLTSDICINLAQVSSFSTSTNNSKVSKDTWRLIPQLFVSMNNGKEYKVETLADIYNFCSESFDRTVTKLLWVALIAKLNKEMSEDNTYFLSAEDSDYLTKEV